MAVAEKNERCFLPDVPIKTILIDYRDHFHDVVETLFLRAKKAPENIWYEADDVKHVFIDGFLAIGQSCKRLTKLLARDVFKWDELEILDKPCTGGSGPVLLMESYTWTAMCILAYAMGTFLGDYEPVTSFISPIFPSECAQIAAIAVLFLTHAKLRKMIWHEDEQRTEAFYSSICFGMLASYAVGKPSTDFASILPILPLWIGTVAGYREFYKPCRNGFLNWTITVPCVIYCVIAFFSGRNLAYILAWLILCAVVAVDLQLKIGRLIRRWASKDLEYWGTTAVIISVHFLLNHFVSYFAPTPENRG